jgi:glutathione S-transferase
MQGKCDVPQDKIDAIHRGYRGLEKYLEKTTFLASNRMTVADLCVFAWMESITQVVTVSSEDYPKISSWLSTLRQLPYYEEANKVGADLHIKLFRDALKTNGKH